MRTPSSSPLPYPHPAPAPPTAPLTRTLCVQTRITDFTEDPFKDYRYEDPFNIEDPFADVTDARRIDAVARPPTVAGFETDDLFSSSSAVNGSFTLPEKRSGRVSAPPVAYDPFATRSDFKSTNTSVSSTNNNSNNDTWAAWPNDNWATEDAWSKPSSQTNQKRDAWATNANQKSDWKTDNWANKTDNWATKSDNWAADWDQNKNLNETWPSNTMPSKKEKSPKPVKYAKSLVHTIGGIGRNKANKEKKSKSGTIEAKSVEFLPTEEQQWAWAAAESKRAAQEDDERRRREDAELQLALAISRQEK